jgi:hypothetical protein
MAATSRPGSYPDFPRFLPAIKYDFKGAGNRTLVASESLERRRRSRRVINFQTIFNHARQNRKAEIFTVLARNRFFNIKPH